MSAGNRRWLTWPKLIFASLALLLIAAWYVPKISASRFREPIRAGLEDALGRKVEISEVKFQLLPVPGFTVTNVIVGEDPSIGTEPVAYISTLRGRPRISSLFGGPLEFASVDLEDTSVNLTRVDGPVTRWNFSSLVRPRTAKAFPDIHLIGGRVNFKFGVTKSVFYLLDTDVDLWPPSSADGPWTLRVHSFPARTDRRSHGFGSFSARGEWLPNKALVTLDVKLEKSELGDVVTLFEGKESYLQGHIWGDAHLSGPISRVGLAGRLRSDDIHGWNQTPPGGGAWPISLGGAIDLPGQVVEFRATTEGKQSPIDLRYRVTNYLAQPHWGVTMIFSQLPIAPVAGIVRNLGFAVPPELKLDGMAQGAIGYSVPEGTPRLEGRVRVENPAVSLPNAPPLHFADADLQFTGSTITLAPLVITNEAKESANLGGSFDVSDQKLSVSVSSDGMAVASLQKQLSMANVPLLGLATSGTWSGQFGFISQPQAAWSGEVRLKDADLPLEALSQPVHLNLADATFSAAGLATKRLSFAVGGIDGQGEYHYETGAERPHRFRLAFGVVDAAALEKLLAPALQRGSFLTYAFNFGRVPEPDWMRSLHADGTVQMASLFLGNTSAAGTITKLRTRIQWDGDQAHFIALQGNMGDAGFNGSATVNLSQREPSFEVAGKLAGFAWHAGMLEADGTMTTSGTGQSLLTNMKAAGTLHGRNIDLSPVEQWDLIDGNFDLSWNGRTPRLRLGQLSMTSAGSKFQGTAETQKDGKLILRVTDGTRQIQAAGALLQGEPLKPSAP